MRKRTAFFTIISMIFAIIGTLSFPEGMVSGAAKKVVPLKKKVTIKQGKKAKLRLKNSKGNKIVWKSTREKVVSVNKKGVVYGKKKGKAKVVAKYKNKKYIFKIIVKKSNSNKESSSNGRKADETDRENIEKKKGEQSQNPNIPSASDNLKVDLPKLSKESADSVKPLETAGVTPNTFAGSPRAESGTPVVSPRVSEQPNNTIPILVKTTSIPGNKVMPEPTVKPEVTSISEPTVMPEATSIPESTVIPEATVTPNATVIPTEEPITTIQPSESPIPTKEPYYDPSIKLIVKMTNENAPGWVKSGEFGDVRIGRISSYFSSKPYSSYYEGSCYNNGFAFLLNNGKEIDISNYKYVRFKVEKDAADTVIKLMTWSDGADCTSFWDRTDTWDNVVKTEDNGDRTITLYYEVNTVFSDPATATAIGLTLKSDYNGDDNLFKEKSCKFYGFEFVNVIDES